jgi:uncharacterized protein (DUF433 family)
VFLQRFSNSAQQIFQRPLPINRRNFWRKAFEDNFSVETEPHCADNYRLGYMNKNLTETEIDELVILQANDDDAWEKPIRVNRKKAFSLNFSQPSEIISEKDILSGTPVFRGTRVPVSALLDNLENGVSLDEFLENFPTVKREQAVKVLELFKNSLTQLQTV